MSIDATASIFYGINIGEVEDGNDDIENKADKLLDKFGCEITYHGNMITYGGDAAVCIKSTEKICWAGETLIVDNLQVEPDWDDRLKQFCEALDIPFETPHWLMVASYG